MLFLPRLPMMRDICLTALFFLLVGLGFGVFGWLAQKGELKMGDEGREMRSTLPPVTLLGGVTHIGTRSRMLSDAQFTGERPAWDLSRCEAEHLRLFDLDAPGLITRQANMRGSEWRNVRASKLIAPQVDISGSYFEHCHLRGADFSGAFGTVAAFIRCDLERAIFEGAFLEHATFIDCALDNATFIRASLFGAQIRRCSLARVDFLGANLRDIQWADNEAPNAVGLVSDLEILRTVEQRIRGYRFVVHDASDSWHGQEYQVGSVYETGATSGDPSRGCAEGLHMGTLDWVKGVALAKFGLHADATPCFDILELSTATADIIVPWEGGRWRTRRFRVERMLPLAEWWEQM